MNIEEFRRYKNQYEDLIAENKIKLIGLENKYYLDKLFAKGFFADEYNKFKEKTGKILIATYNGQSSMDPNNYSFKIVDKNYKHSNFDREFVDDCVFESLIIDLYDNPRTHFPHCFDSLLKDTFHIKL